MVKLLDIYNIKESTFSELKKDRDPARGDKGKTSAKDYYLVDEPADPETGKVKSKVIYKRSFTKMIADLEAEAIDFKKLSDDNPNDMVLYNLSEELKDLFSLIEVSTNLLSTLNVLYSVNSIIIFLYIPCILFSFFFYYPQMQKV